MDQTTKPTIRERIREALRLHQWRPRHHRDGPINDPFAPAQLRQAPNKSTVPIPQFDAIPRMDMEVIKSMGQRVVQILSDMQARGLRVEVPPWPMCACDIAVAHLQRPLDLRAFAAADDVAFMGAYMFIAQRLNRLTFQIDGLHNHPYAARGARR